MLRTFRIHSTTFRSAHLGHPCNRPTHNHRHNPNTQTHYPSAIPAGHSLIRTTLVCPTVYVGGAPLKQYILSGRMNSPERILRKDRGARIPQTLQTRQLHRTPGASICHSTTRGRGRARTRARARTRTKTKIQCLLTYLARHQPTFRHCLGRPQKIHVQDRPLAVLCGLHLQQPKEAGRGDQQQRL